MVYSIAKLDRTFAALADPTRRALLARLARGETSVSDLASPFAMSLPAVSKHLQVLRHAGLATIRRDGRVRRCRLRPGPLRDAADWVERYRKFWEGHLNQLARYLGDTHVDEESTTPWPLPPLRSLRTGSRFAGSSAHHPNASSGRGRRRKN
ncbi:MAG: metalloregulator ArsR/SmtB family transcription factor [Gemmatimonadales bacterium]